MRAMKRLALVALFALPMVMTGCEKLGDATGPEMTNVGGPSAAQVKVVVGTDSSKVEVGATAPTPPPDDPADPDGGYIPAWP